MDSVFRLVVVNREGTRIASAQHIEEATQLLRALPAGDRVLDSVTGVVLAYVPRKILPSLGQA